MRTIGDWLRRLLAPLAAVVFSLLFALAMRRRSREQVKAERRRLEQHGRSDVGEVDRMAEQEVQNGLERESLADYFNRSSRG